MKAVSLAGLLMLSTWAWARVDFDSAAELSFDRATIESVAALVPNSFALRRALDFVSPTSAPRALFRLELPLDLAFNYRQARGQLASGQDILVYNSLGALGFPGARSLGLFGLIQTEQRNADPTNPDDANYAAAASHHLQIFETSEKRPLGVIDLPGEPHELTRAEQLEAQKQILDLAEARHWRLERLLVRLDYQKSSTQFRAEVEEWLSQTLPTAFRALDHLHKTNQIANEPYETVQSQLVKMKVRVQAFLSTTDKEICNKSLTDL